MATPSEAVSNLVRVYRQAALSLANDLIGNLDFERGGRARTFSAINRTLVLLKELDTETDKWARRNIPAIYRATQKSTAQRLRRLGLTKRDVQRSSTFASINPLAVDALINDPDTGLVTSLKDGTDQIRARIRSIRNQARLLTKQRRLINETVARVGLIEGRSINQVRDALVRELRTVKKSSDLIIRNQMLGSGNSLVRQIAEVPFVKIATVKGDRHVRLEDYARMVARTKTRQVETVARRAKMMQHEQLLVRISTNKPLDEDACSLYIGKVFGLTKEAARENGVPHVDELPGGGVPFHPNCTHTEAPFTPALASREVVALAMSPPPRWALNKPFGRVQKEFKRRGGLSKIKQFNKAVETGGFLRRQAGTG